MLRTRGGSKPRASSEDGDRFQKDSVENEHDSTSHEDLVRCVADEVSGGAVKVLNRRVSPFLFVLYSMSFSSEGTESHSLRS